MCQDLQLGESVVVNPLDLAVFHGNFIEMKQSNRAETVLRELLDVVTVHVEDLQQILLVQSVLEVSFPGCLCYANYKFVLPRAISFSPISLQQSAAVSYL